MKTISNIHMMFDKEKLDKLAKEKPDGDDFVKKNYIIEEGSIDPVHDNPEVIEISFATPLWYGSVFVKPTKEEWVELLRKAVNALHSE